jgi:hypothetical protein
MRQVTIGASALLIMGLVFGCGGAPLPESSVSATQAAIRAAREVGAEGVPQAALHLRYATDQFDEAQSLEEEGDEERAAYVLIRAEADAELAIEITRAHMANQEADEVEAEAQELQQRGSR